MSEKLNAVMIPMNEQEAAQTTLIELGNGFSKVSAAIVNGAPALCFHKTLDAKSPTFTQDFHNPANIVMVRFGDPRQVEALLHEVEMAVKPFAEAAETKKSEMVVKLHNFFGQNNAIN